MNKIAKKERMLELLTDEVLFGLSEQESVELQELLAEFPEFKPDDSLEQTATAISLSNLPLNEPMPKNLQAKILADADKFFGFEKKEEVAEVSEKPSDYAIPSVTQNADIRTLDYEKPTSSWTSWLGWGIAAFACLALAVNIWMTRINPNEDVAKNPTPTETPKKEPSIVEQKQQLLASAKDLVKTIWASADKTKELDGEIVWSNEKQEGYATFRGLPTNDKSKETYQLWIFDKNQDEKTPVDGGVFDVNENGEVIIKLDPKIKVGDPKMFAVTAEKPGGVVVSKQEKVVALAKVEI